MKRVLDHIRDDCFRKGYGVPFDTIRMPSHAEMVATQWSQSFENEMRKFWGDAWSDEFIQLMKNRLIMGPFRYGGLLADPRKANYDRVGYAIIKLKAYASNQRAHLEELVDAANCLLLEWVEGQPLCPDTYESTVRIWLVNRLAQLALKAYQEGRVGRPVLADIAGYCMNQFAFWRAVGTPIVPVDDHPVHAVVQT